MPKSSNDQADSNVFERDWSAYYNAVAGRPPRETLIAALERFDGEKLTNQSRFAVDLCCGDGRDSWAIYTSMNHPTREQVEALLQPFEIEMFEEEEHPGKTALGEEKYWHLFQIVVRKC